METPIKQVLERLIKDGFHSDVDYWEGFQEDENISEKHPLGFDANIYAIDEADFSNGFVISTYPLEEYEDSVIVFTNDGSTYSEEFTAQDYSRLFIQEIE